MSMNIKAIFLVIAAIVGLVVLTSNKAGTRTQNSPASLISPSPTQTYSKDAPNKVDASLDVLTALSYYYLAGTNTSTYQDPDVMTQAITTLLKQNENMKNGNAFVQKYVNDPNTVISLSAEGMTLGSNQVIKANNDFINYIRTANLNDSNFNQNLSYAVAKHNTDRESGYKTILVSAPQISSLYYDYPKQKNPTGAIPYLLSPSDRKLIINKMNTLFGDLLKQFPKGYDSSTDTYDSILVAVDSIRKNIVPETYEETSK